MKRWTWIFLLTALVAAAYILSRPVEVLDCTGSWICPENSQVYTFREGMISTADMPVSGAYCPAKEKVLLFCSEISELEREQELFLVKQKGTETLCATRDGQGKVYFCRKK